MLQATKLSLGKNFVPVPLFHNSCRPTSTNYPQTAMTQQVSGGPKNKVIFHEQCLVLFNGRPS